MQMLILLSILLFIASSDTPYCHEDRIMVENVADFGRVNKFKMLQHTFVLRNISEETLSLRIVEPTCNCIRVSLEKQYIARNESIAVCVEYHPDIHNGYFDKSVTVIVSGCKRPLILRLRGFVEKSAKSKRNINFW